jgi:hypothetical protein
MENEITFLALQVSERVRRDRVVRGGANGSLSSSSHYSHSAVLSIQIDVVSIGQLVCEVILNSLGTFMNVS